MKSIHSLSQDICKECAPLVKKDCEICMKKFPKEDSSVCVKKALVKQGKKACMECAKCEKPKLPFIEPVQVVVVVYLRYRKVASQHLI